MIVNLLNPTVTHSSYKVMSDEEVLKQYMLTQNVNYFNLIFDRYTDKVYAKCISMLQDSSLAEDANQEIFVKILLNLSKFKGNSKFSTWLYSVTYNYCIDVIRKNKRNITVSVADYHTNDVKDDECMDAEILETNVYRLKNVLSKMNDDDKVILMMKYQDDLSIKEICESINKTESAVKMKILRAKQRFLKIYNEQYAKMG
ncbi:MAG: sigma-70 family RNA polymerase sigma factor [Saprospiraceae bacterium]